MSTGYDQRVRHVNPDDDDQYAYSYDLAEDVLDVLGGGDDTAKIVLDGYSNALVFHQHSDDDVTAWVENDGNKIGVEVVIPDDYQIQDAIHFYLHNQTLAGWEPDSEGGGAAGKYEDDEEYLYKEEDGDEDDEDDEDDEEYDDEDDSVEGWRVNPARGGVKIRTSWDEKPRRERLIQISNPRKATAPAKPKKEFVPGQPLYTDKSTTGPLGVGKCTYDSENSKVGISTCTYATQASCPNGRNSSYLCPLLGEGCYAEDPKGYTKFTTNELNRHAGFSNKDPVGSSPIVTPDQVAADEAFALRDVYDRIWKKKSSKQPMRVHVVGDCVTSKSAGLVSDAAEPFAFTLPYGAKSVWAYTHAWRDVSRGSWSSRLSVLASVDTIEDLEAATRRGWACAMVIQRFQQSKLGNYVAVRLQNKLTAIPCPFEVNRVVEASGGKRAHVQCVMNNGAGGCRLCLKEDFLKSIGGFVTFAAHGSVAEKTVSKHVDLKEYM